MLTVKQAVAHIRKSPKLHGVVAQYCHVNDDWGLKWYEDEYKRDDTYVVQEQLSDLGLAPRLGNKIDFVLDGYQCWGYFTERVEVIGDKLMADKGWTQRDRRYDEVEDFLDNYAEELHSSDEFCEFRNAIEAAGFNFEDDHIWNIGRNKSGQLMCIDVGED